MGLYAQIFCLSITLCREVSGMASSINFAAYELRLVTTILRTPGKKYFFARVRNAKQGSLSEQDYRGRLQLTCI